MPLSNPAKTRRSTANRISKVRLAAMIEESTADAYGDSEQTTGWYTMFEEHLALPFETTMLGVVFNVARLELRGDNDIIAICTRGRERQYVPILDLPLPRPWPVGAEWIEAYRHWVGG
jgi:Calcium binding